MSQLFNIVQDDLNYHVAKKHSAPRPSITYKCKLCHVEFPGFYALRQHKNAQHGTQIGFGASNIHVEDIVGGVDDQSFQHLPCHPSTCLCLTINCIKYSKN